MQIFLKNILKLNVNIQLQARKISIADCNLLFLFVIKFSLVVIRIFYFMDGLESKKAFFAGNIFDHNNWVSNIINIQN